MATSDPHKPFHITIATSPAGGITVERDLQLVKAALLYADAVDLYSPSASAILQALLLGELTFEQRVGFLEELANVLLPYKPDLSGLVQAMPRIRSILRKKRPTKGELLWKLRFQHELTKAWAGLQEMLDRMAEESGAVGLASAVESGMLRMNFFDEAKGTDALVRDYLEILTRVLSDVSTYPLFDQAISGLVGASIREGHMKVSTVRETLAKHVGLAADLFERLPLFERATVDEILLVRKELDRFLVRFRAAMVRFADQIESASWDEDFPMEADTLFRGEVEPAILAIEEAVASNKYIVELARKFVNKPLNLVPGPVLALVLSSYSNMPEVVPPALGLAASAAILATDAYLEWKDKQRKIEQNGLFFYYKTGTRLSRLA